MKLTRRRFLLLVGGAAALPAVPRLSWAQAYPMKPITMVAPFAVGGGTDALARIIAERMRASLGQPIIVENVAGANGSIGVGRVARAAHDGHTVLEHLRREWRSLYPSVRRSERFRTRLVGCNTAVFICREECLSSQ